MKKVTAFLFVLLAVRVSAGVPQIPITANLEGTDNQWNILTKVGNTPAIVATMKQGTNSWDASNWTAVFKYGKDKSTGAMASITGTVSSSTITFQAETNSFTVPVERWYSVIMLTSNNYTISTAEGLITVDRSPEVDAGTFNYLYAINGPLYSFTGTFTNWPFLADDDGSAVGDVAYFDGTNWVALGAGTTNHFLRTLGTGYAPEWSDPAGYISGFVSQADFDLVVSTQATHTAAIALNTTHRSSDGSDHSLVNTALQRDGSVARTADQNYGGYAPTNVAHVTFKTNETRQITGTVNSTNFVGWIDGTNTYRILFDQ